ncbi:MAG: endonuclease/exonuclease/phosphatase family protein [Deltaproteobacteria bacterium]|jgi:endonuclease/exonuclease/phosphatase family metal-dependent hydrolase
MRVAFFVCLTLLGCSGSAPNSAIRELSVVSINLRHDQDFWEERFDLVADEIVRLDPDLIGLQEIEISVDQSQVLHERIVERGGADYAIFEQLKFGVQGLGGEGVGVFSRFPILETDAVDLDHGRPGVFVRLSLGDGERIEFFNTHLHNVGEDEVRRAQMQSMVAFADQHADGAPQILTGDMNALPDSGTLNAALDVGWRDSFTDANPSALGATSGIRLRKDDPTPQRAQNRIDYVLYAPRGRLSVVSSTVTFDRPRADGLYPSDHLGVLSVFELR